MVEFQDQGATRRGRVALVNSEDVVIITGAIQGIPTCTVVEKSGVHLIPKKVAGLKGRSVSS